MKGYNFRDLARDVLAATQRPMSPDEIWETAVESGLAERVASRGATPARTIGARLYTSIRDDPNTEFAQVSKRPARFALQADLRDAASPNPSPSPAAANASAPADAQAAPTPAWTERDLHPLLATYVRSDAHFRCYAKTIYQEKSIKGPKNADKWTHPDMVGVYVPFNDYEDSVIQLQDTLCINPYKLFSFELKKSLTASHLREYFFQAVSNSSWANEGYLVAPSISNDADFLEDLQRLSNAFGIGVIRLNIEHAEQSEVVFQARTNNNLDWPTVDRLARINPDFHDFIVSVNNTVKIHVVSGSYDKVLRGDSYDAYLKAHGMAS